MVSSGYLAKNTTPQCVTHSKINNTHVHAQVYFCILCLCIILCDTSKASENRDFYFETMIVCVVVVNVTGQGFTPRPG